MLEIVLLLENYKILTQILNKNVLRMLIGQAGLIWFHQYQ